MVKCRVLGADPARKGLKLSLVSKSKAAGAGDGEEAPAAEAGAGSGGKARPGKAAAAGSDAAAEAALGAFQPGDVVRGTVVALHSKEVSPFRVWRAWCVTEQWRPPARVCPRMIWLGAG